MYPIATFEAFARKEIFYITFFLLNCYLAIRINNRDFIFLSTNIFILLSYFIHESSFFFLFFFYLSYFVFLKKNNYKIKIREIFLIIIVYSVLLYLLFIPVTDEKISKMVFFVNQNFFEITEFSGAISWLQRSASSAFLFLKYNHPNIREFFQNVLFLHYLIIFLYLLYLNNFFKLGKYFFIFTIISFLSPIVLFLVGNDWGRFVYILYNFCLIFTFYCLHEDKKIFIKIDKIPIINNLNYKFKLFITICYISLWTPKIFHYDKVEFFALYRVVLDLIKYSLKYSTLLL